jgi:hypothetical protein
LPLVDRPRGGEEIRMAPVQPSPPVAVDEAALLMSAFAARTGLASEVVPTRYLWTDAFAVCNFLALAGKVDRDLFLGHATRLVEQVHHVLGRHRPDDARRGWISGLAEDAGEVHPTAGGLRIGKPLPERDARQPADPALEWERDGQYFHYLTRWMHALDQFAHATGDAGAERWACELALAAHAAFHVRAGGANRLVWKMSIDLSRPLVSTMGHHDPLDGLITCLQLQARRDPARDPDLSAQIRDMAAMVDGRDWRTDDPLGLGGLLADAWRLAQLPGGMSGRRQLVATLLEAAVDGLSAYQHQRPLQRPLSRRLAFRELGLAIGLHAVARLRSHDFADRAPGSALSGSLATLARSLPLADAIEADWREPASQRTPNWLAHEDINAVMLATALLPAGYLDLQ